SCSAMQNELAISSSSAMYAASAVLPISSIGNLRPSGLNAILHQESLSRSLIKFLDSTRETNTAHKNLKARVRAERIEARPQQDAWIKALFVGFFEPIHRLIVIAESGIHHGNLRGIRITRVRVLLQFTQ